MRYILALCILLSLCTICQAVPTSGVLVQERVVRLPEDGSKWYISVVGDTKGERYLEVLGWFDSGKLRELRDQVHFIQVTTDTAIYSERYRPNVKGLPTVRVQRADGSVVYEAHGEYLPMSGDALYNAIAKASSGTEAWFPWNRKPDPKPDPKPEPVVNPVVTPDTDPAPQPLNDNQAPSLEPISDIPVGLIVGVVSALIIGLVTGQIEKRKREML